MFTGIVQAVGRVESLQRQGAGARLTVGGAARLLAKLKRGDSIAVNGCCLTIVQKRGGIFVADLTAETLARTALGGYGKGTRVNLEPPLRMGDALSGHIVQGHVEGTGKLLEMRPEGGGGYSTPDLGRSLRSLRAVASLRGSGRPLGSGRLRAAATGGWWMRVAVPADIRRRLKMKGSVALDGISLTVAEMERGGIAVAIIPFTHEHTNLRRLQPGAAMNIETDHYLLK